MNIEYVKDLTEADRDGFRLLYKVDNNELEIQISGTLLGMFSISANNAEELLEQYRFEVFIENIDTFYSKENSFIKKIELTSNGLHIKGKIYYSANRLRDFIAKKD